MINNKTLNQILTELFIFILKKLIFLLFLSLNLILKCQKMLD